MHHISIKNFWFLRKSVALALILEKYSQNSFVVPFENRALYFATALSLNFYYCGSCLRLICCVNRSVVTRDPAKHNKVAHGITANAVAAMHTAGSFASGIQTGNDISLRIKNLCVCVDLQTAHSVMDSSSWWNRYKKAQEHSQNAPALSLLNLLIHGYRSHSSNISPNHRSKSNPRSPAGRYRFCLTVPLQLWPLWYVFFDKVSDTQPFGTSRSLSGGAPSILLAQDRSAA